MKIQETIVVEGKSDETRLKQLYDTDIIRTEGTRLSKNTLAAIQEAQKEHGVIVFTDPDHPGEEIRRKINDAIPGCKNAFLTSKSRHKDKVGVEHATKEEITEALNNLLTEAETQQETLSFDEYIALNLSGKPDSSARRQYLEDYYHLGHGSAKTLFKRLNRKQLTAERLLLVLQEANYE